MLHFKETSCASTLARPIWEMAHRGDFYLRHELQLHFFNVWDQNFANSLRPEGEKYISTFGNGNDWMSLIIMVRKEDVFPVGRLPSGWFLLVFIQLISIVTRDNANNNGSSGPGERVTGHTWAWSRSGSPMGRPCVGIIWFPACRDLCKGIWGEELDINLVWSLVTAGGASWTLSRVSTGICRVSSLDWAPSHQ